MALLQNQRIIYQLPLRFRGAVGFESRETNRTARRNLFAGDGSVQLAAVPNGAQPGNAILTQQKAGQIASYTAISGTAALAASGALGRNVEASIDASSTFAATGELVVSGSASIAGVSSLSGALVSVVDGSATINGTSVCFGAWSALVSAQANCPGLSTMFGVPRANGTLAANITPFTELSPQSLSDAVWAKGLEAGLSAAELMRIMTAVLAGKTTIVGSTASFRDVADSKNRVVATMTGSERVAIARDGT